MDNKKLTTPIGDYIENGYVGHKELMPTDAYSNALDALVLACVDIVLVYKGKVLIARRTQHPQADWWMIGGRMRAGENLTSSASRLVHDEVSVRIENDRFKYLTVFAAAWNKRAHSPITNGTHTLSVVFTAVLTGLELERIKLNREYSECKLITIDELIGNRTKYHPALVQCVNALKAQELEC